MYIHDVSTLPDAIIKRKGNSMNILQTQEKQRFIKKIYKLQAKQRRFLKRTVTKIFLMRANFVFSRSATGNLTA